MKFPKSILISAKQRLKHPFRRENQRRATIVESQEPRIKHASEPRPTDIEDAEHPSTSPPHPEVVPGSLLPPVPVADEEISVNIFINYNDELLDEITGCRVRWLQPQLLEVLENEVASCLKKCSLVPEAARLYREAGECSLIRQSDRRAMSITTWKHKEQWRDALPSMIMNFCLAHKGVPFYLDIKWEYVDPRILKVPGETYVNTVGQAIKKKMTENWKETKYISQSNLKIILSKNTISLLVDEDESLRRLSGSATATKGGEDSFDRDSLIDWVWTDGIRLLALHVYAKMPLLSLLRMKEQGMLDAHLLEKPLTEKDCPCEDHSHTFELLVRLQDSFVLHTFPRLKLNRPPTHHDLHHKIGMPIKSHGRLGTGSFGEVFKVSIEAGHHDFPCDNKNGLFAMKVFFNFGQRTQEDFNRESKMLQTLAEFPHEHITPYLASWTHGDTFYMLFPLATSNLRTFLDKKNERKLDASFVLWLFSQLSGLADGVRVIHNIGGGSKSTVHRFHEKVSGGKARIGFHHDLRPENILLFEKADCPYPTLRISDFGSANSRQLPSGALANSRRSIKTRGFFDGDPAYGAPESDAVEGTSRPYDIWSLGCIFLEIALWVFPYDLTGVSDFLIDRLTNSRDPTLKSQTQAFWYKTPSGETKLKRCVTIRLKKLIAHCTERGSFKDLISIIRKMLSIQPADRITAAELFSALDGVYQSVKSELRSNPAAYEEQGDHIILAGPPTNVIDDLTSIDDTPTPTQLTPNGLEHRRTTSDGKRARRSLERSSFSDPFHLHPIDTDVTVSETNGRPRSPTISISHVDHPESVIDGMDDLDDIEYGPPVGGHSVTWGLEDLINRRPPSARSRRSFSEGDLPVTPSGLGL